MVLTTAVVEWSFVMKEHGELYVRMNGMKKMLVLCAGNLVSQAKVGLQ